MAKASEAKQTEALTKAQSTAVERPAWMENEPVEGFEGMTSRHMVVPRISVAQSNTKAAKRANPLYIEGLTEGLFYNSLTKKVYGDYVDFIPLFFFTNRIMFKDINQGGGILCVGRPTDGGMNYACQLNHGGPCLHDNFGPGGEKPECTEFFNYPSAILVDGVIVGEIDLAVLSFKSVQMKKAKELNSRMRQLKASMFAQKWRVRAVPDKKDQFDYFTVEFDFLGYAESAELVEILRKEHRVAKEGFGSGMMEVDADEGGSEDRQSGPKQVGRHSTAAASEM